MKYSPAMLFIFGILFFTASTFAADPYTQFTRLNLNDAYGPDSVALDRFYQGPYVGVNDGRIQKYFSSFGFVDFATTSPNRTKQLCDGITNPDLGPICGRPYGFSFNLLTGNLYIVDAYLGLFRVGPFGGQATLLANTANGVPFKYLSGVDVDPLTGVVYFTDASTKYTLTDVIQLIAVPGDSTGRLMSYNPITRQVKVLAQGLPTPAGPAASADGSSVFFTSFTTNQVFKHWLIGPKANTTEVLFNLTGFPIKIKRAARLGEFWVAVNEIVQQQQPRVLKPFGYRFKSNGDILLIKDLSGQYPNAQVNVLQEYSGGVIYVGSRVVTYVGIYSK